MKKFLVVFIVSVLLTTLSYSEIFDRIFLIVNNDSVSLNEFKKLVKERKKALVLMGIKSPKNLTEMVLKDLIREKLVNQYARKKDLYVTENEINNRIEKIRTMNRMSESTFKAELKRAGISYEKFKEDQRKRILLEKIIDLEIRPKIQPPSDEEMKDYYKKNKKKMFSPAKIRISQILIKNNPNADLSLQTKNKEKAKKILQKALNGANFSKLAKKYSEDEVSASLGGDIGYITKGEWLGPQIDALFFRLKKGQVFPELVPARGGMGWHIVKIIDKNPKRFLTFEEIKPKIESLLLEQKISNEFENWINKQKQNAYIEIIFSDNEKYTFEGIKWKKVGSKFFVSEKDLLKKIDSMVL